MLQEFNHPHFSFHYEVFSTLMSVIFSSVNIVIFDDMPSKVRTVRPTCFFRNELIQNMFIECSLSYMQTVKIKYE
jgi:hypothetical protein